MLFCFDTKKKNKTSIYLDLDLFSFYRICMLITLELPMASFLSNLCFAAIGARFTTHTVLEIDIFCLLLYLLLIKSLKT